MCFGLTYSGLLKDEAFPIEQVNAKDKINTFIALKDLMIGKTVPFNHGTELSI